jgi:hypothetical protein
VSLLGHPNRLLGSQALQLLLLATHPDMYDWHSPPGHNTSSNAERQQQQQAPQCGASDAGSSSMRQLGSSSSNDTASGSTSNEPQAAAAGAFPDAAAAAAHPWQGPDAQLWLQLLQLHEGPLLQRLLALSPDAWPSSGHQALQLLAFYLLWLKAWWSKVRSHLGCFVVVSGGAKCCQIAAWLVWWVSLAAFNFVTAPPITHCCGTAQAAAR